MESIGIRKYIITYGVCYTIGLVAVIGVLKLLELEGNSGVSIGVLIGSAMYAASKFISDNKRVPNKAEKSKLVWQSFLVSWLVSLILLLIIVASIIDLEEIPKLSEDITQTNIAIIMGATVFASLIQWGILTYSYGSLAKKQYATLVKKGKI